MKIDINKKYRYRSGAAARVICVDAPSEFPVIAIDDGGDPSTHTDEGRLLLGGESVHDLVEVREPREWTLAVAQGNPAYADGAISEARTRNGQFSETWVPVRVREIID